MATQNDLLKCERARAELSIDAHDEFMNGESLECGTHRTMEWRLPCPLHGEHIGSVTIGHVRYEGHYCIYYLDDEKQWQIE